MFQASLIIIFSVMLITPDFLHELVKVKVLFDTKMKYIILHKCLPFNKTLKDIK